MTVIYKLYSRAVVELPVNYLYIIESICDAPYLHTRKSIPIQIIRVPCHLNVQYFHVTVTKLNERNAVWTCSQCWNTKFRIVGQLLKQ
jgi:hypothetical protein